MIVLNSDISFFEAFRVERLAFRCLFRIFDSYYHEHFPIAARGCFFEYCVGISFDKIISREPDNSVNIFKP